MAHESPRRILVWADGSAEAAYATGWAAVHAAARALPLHLVHVIGVGDRADAGRPGIGGTGAAHDQAAVDVVRLAQEVRRIRRLHPALPVTIEVLEDAAAHRSRPPAAPGDLLVTSTAGFLRFAADGAGDGDGARGHQPVPVVVVPDAPPDETRGAGRPRLLLLTGPRLSPDTAAFAFTAAADLGASLDVVRVAPQGEAFGDDYWIDAGRSPYRGESRLQSELAKLRARFPMVPGVAVTLRTRPWTTLRTMARSTHLAVLSGGPDLNRDLRTLLEIAACPVAVVPDN